MKRVLVTGGAGFIGSEVVKQLSVIGARVTVLDNFSSGKAAYIEGLDHVIVVKGDVCDRGSIAGVVERQDLVIHMCALPFIPDSYYHPEEFFATNVMGTINLIQGVIRSQHVENFVHVSSSEVYGTALYSPMDEKHPTLPHSTYAVSKLAADRVVFTMHKEHGLPVVIIRPFNCYGPNVTQPYIIPELAIQLLNGRDKLALGNIEASRDMSYVSDTARGIIAALSTEGIDGETINLGYGKTSRIRELVEKMASILGKQVEIEIDKARYRPYDVQNLICDNGKAKSMLDWQPEIPLDEGLKLTLDWFSRNKIFFTSPFRGWPSSYRETRNLLTPA